MNKNDFFKISELASALGTTSRTLRFYEDEGFFSPDYIDPDTGYRFYSVANLVHLQLILQLKKANLPISDIYDYFNGLFDYDRVRADLSEKNNSILRSLGLVASHLNRGNIYEVAEGIFPGGRYIEKEVFCENAGDIRTTFRTNMFELLKNKVKIDSDFSHYLQVREEKNGYKISLNYHTISEESSTKLQSKPMIYTYHVGKYCDMYKAYAALETFAECENILICGNGMEFPLASTTLSAEEGITMVAYPVDKYTNIRATVDASTAKKRKGV